MTEQNNFYDVIIVGAGAAGLMAAGAALEKGLSVLLFDKNEKPGRKLRITGKGRCNVTNNCTKETVIASTVSNPRFLYSALNFFSPEDTMSFFENLGVALKTERGNRVFPVSDKADDIAEALINYASGAKVIRNTVKEVIAENGEIKGVKTENKTYFSKNVLIATGGASYKATGSTGDGFKFAEKLGHSITPLSPSLVALCCEDKDIPEAQGLSLRNIGFKITDKVKNKVIYEDFGELLFTHFGISGPVVLSGSAHLKDMAPNRYSASIDLKPALTREKLDERLLRDFAENKNKDFVNSLQALLPQKLIDVVIKRSGIDGRTKCNSITKKQREALLNVLKDFTAEISDFRSLNEAIVTRGGVSVKEINPKTMESKIIKGLYFAGEVIDVDAYTGGFNLQIAFSTARLAAENFEY